MERVAFLIQETGQRLECLLNPETLVWRRAAGIAPRRSTAGRVTGAGMTDDPLLYTGGGNTEIDLDLLFDVSLAGASAAEDVRELTSPLWNLAENGAQSERYGRPPTARLIWGKSFNVLGVVVSVAERLERFTAEGAPQQSWLRLRMRRVSEPPPSPPQAAGPAARVAPLSLDSASLRVPETTLAVHRVIGGAAQEAAAPSIAGAVVTGADIIAGAVAETPAGRALLQTQADLAGMVDDMIAQVGAWLRELGDSPLLREIGDRLSQMARRVGAVVEAAKTRVVETAVGAAAAVAGAAQTMWQEIQEAGKALSQEIVEALQPLLGNVVPVARAMGEAARLVARAVKARAARLAAAAAAHIDWAVDRVEAALEQVSSAARRAAAGVIEKVKGAAADLRGVLADMAQAGKMALAEAIPSALVRIGGALEELWSMGEAAAARAIEGGVRAASAGLQRLAAAAEAIRSVTRDRILPAARAALGALRESLRVRPTTVAGEALEKAAEPEAEFALPERTPAAALTEVEIAVDALRSVFAPQALAPAEEALERVRAALDAHEPPDLEEALLEIERAIEEGVAGQEEIEIQVAGAVSALRERLSERESGDEGPPAEAQVAPPGAERAPAGERLDQIAYRYYQDAALWRLLALANDVPDPLRLAPDRPLRIPTPVEWRTT